MLGDTGKLIFKHAPLDEGRFQPAGVVKEESGVGTTFYAFDLVDKPLQQLVADPLALVAVSLCRGGWAAAPAVAGLSTCGECGPMT